MIEIFKTRKAFSLGGWLLPLLVIALIGSSAQADVTLPNIFGDHMVFQQGQKNKVWGIAVPGESITVTFDKQVQKATAGTDGTWNVMLEPVPVGGPYDFSVKGKNEIKFADVLVGEVWVCSGQSNMEWTVDQVKDPDLERLTAKYPKIRMINFPHVGSQEPKWSHDNCPWMVCTPKSVGRFSAVGYNFARQLYQTLDVPIGMVNNSWSSSSCEAWICRDLLAADPKYQPMLDRWALMDARLAELSAKGTELTEDQKKELTTVTKFLREQHRPANIYNGVLKSHIGYGIKGAIWYQGETNVARAYQYRDLFPLLIKSWRDEWNQGDFPFYWVQLADFSAEQTQPPENSEWAELREAQSMTMLRLPNTGEAVTIDIGEGKDYHPKNKFDVGRRLARWALAKDYGIKIPYHSPQYKSMSKSDNKILLTFDYVDGGWRPFDVKEPRGFTIAGEDGKFVWATARILPDNSIEVFNDQIAAPVSVRYGWADNPIVNMFNGAGLPLTPFRTDDRPGVTINSN